MTEKIMDRQLTQDDEVGALRVWLHNCKKAVEVGTWTGQTAIAIAGALPPGGRLYCVDTFCGDPNLEIRNFHFGSFTADDVRKLWTKRVAQAGYESRIELVEGDSAAMADRFCDEELDLVFIDACHHYPYPLRDMQAWWPKVKPGGVFCGHDHGESWPGVVQSVAEFMKEKSLDKDRLMVGPTTIWRIIK